MKPLIALVFASLAFGQSIETKGTCSPVVKGSGNTINIKTCGLSSEQVAELRGLLKQLLAKQVDRTALMAALDSLQSGQLRIENGVLRIEATQEKQGKKLGEIEERQAPWTINDDSKRKMLSVLQTTSPVPLMIGASDDSGKRFYQGLVEVFGRGGLGWSLSISGNVSAIFPFSGVHCTGPVALRATMHSVEQAFASIGLNVRCQEQNSSEIRLIVGQRPE